MYLSKWGEEPEVNWLGMSQDLTTPQAVALMAKDYLSLDPTPAEYTMALQQLNSHSIEDTPRRVLKRERATIEELTQWAADPKTRGF